MNEECHRQQPRVQTQTNDDDGDDVDEDDDYDGVLPSLRVQPHETPSP